MGGPWSQMELKLHINCMEALAAFLAIKCFTRDEKGVAILLQIDNSVAVSGTSVEITAAVPDTAGNADRLPTQDSYRRLLQVPLTRQPELSHSWSPGIFQV